MSFVQRIRTLSLAFAILFGAMLSSTAPAAAAPQAERHVAPDRTVAQTSVCQGTAYDPYVDYRPVNGVVSKVVVGRVRIDCGAPVISINVVITVQKTGGVSAKRSTACGHDVTFCDVEYWYRYSAGEWRTIGESGSAYPRFSYSNKVQL